MSRTKRFFLMAFLVGCGGSRNADDLVPADAPTPDATPPVPIDASTDALPSATYMTGSLGGSSFVFEYSSVLFDTTSGIHTLCASNVPIEPGDCGYSRVGNHTVLRGKIYFATDGTAHWSVGALTELRRFGVDARVDLARAESLTIHQYDMTAQTITATTSIEFSDGPTSGTMVVRSP